MIDIVRSSTRRDGATGQRCPGCGDWLWVFEGEVYCPTCATYEQPGRHVAAKEQGLVRVRAPCDRCGAMDSLRFDFEEADGEVWRLSLCQGCLVQAVAALLAALPADLRTAWMIHFLNE